MFDRSIFHSLLQSRCGRHQAADPGADRGGASATDQGGNRGDCSGEVVCNARTGVRRQHGWTCTYIELIVDVPVPRIHEQIVDVIKVIPEKAQATARVDVPTIPGAEC